MKKRLQAAKERIQARESFEKLVVHEEGRELHLKRGDDRFARLIPTDKEDIWRLEAFRNIERWECFNFQGTLDECLDFLAENEHYRFWNG
jgi:hypothetical protein